VFRGKVERKVERLMREERNAAVKIQAVVRGWMYRKKVVEKMKLSRNTEINIQKIQ